MDPIILENCILYSEDNLDVFRNMDSNSIDSCVTDPPYGLKFMNKKWDYNVPSVELWKEVLRVMKPGSHLLAFGGTRTYHRLVVNIEDAGFQIRDTICWHYGSGFPKSMNISKAIDKKFGLEREIVGFDEDKFKKMANSPPCNPSKGFNNNSMTAEKGCQITQPSSSEAKDWEGWGTALKPATELIVLARKPIDGTIAENILEYGVGGINIDECRVEFVENDDNRIYNNYSHNAKAGLENGFKKNNKDGDKIELYKNLGRWPANIIHDGSEEVLKNFPNNNLGCKPHLISQNSKYNGWGSINKKNIIFGYDDKNNKSAARFFYCAKTSKKERGEGNTHPTVKPISLMKYLIKLITPKNKIVLDPFMGSGSTGLACIEEECDFIGMEKDRKSFSISCVRISDWLKKQ
jgi:site-specific DNA-methyltransferase (adenine-specific)